MSLRWLHYLGFFIIHVYFSSLVKGRVRIETIKNNFSWHFSMILFHVLSQFIVIYKCFESILSVSYNFNFLLLSCKCQILSKKSLVYTCSWHFKWTFLFRNSLLVRLSCAIGRLDLSFLVLVIKRFISCLTYLSLPDRVLCRFEPLYTKSLRSDFCVFKFLTFHRTCCLRSRS